MASLGARGARGGGGRGRTGSARRELAAWRRPANRPAGGAFCLPVAPRPGLPMIWRHRSSCTCRRTPAAPRLPCRYGLNARPHCEARCRRRERFGAGGGADRTIIVINNNNTEYHIDEHSATGAGLKRLVGEPMNRMVFWIKGGSGAGQGGGGESVLDDQPVNLVAGMRLRIVNAGTFG